MNSRQKILHNIKTNKPEKFMLQQYLFDKNEKDLLDQFRQSVETAGAVVITEKEFKIDRIYPDVKTIFSKIDSYNSTIDLETASLETLKSLDLAILQGEFAVAENGAVWVPEENMGQRIIPFITRHLLIVLDKTQIVANMHEAYDRMDQFPGYGVFISGPSKTADIEQTLVLGAQGPMSLKIILSE